jgi:hypothetical protein
MSRAPIALSPALPSELLTYVLTHQTYPTTLIICQSRSTFLSSLLNTTQHTSPKAYPLAQEETREPHLEHTLPPPRHPLLIPTLHQVATSRYIHLIFIPTLSHLRSYLAVFPHEPGSIEHPEQKFDKLRKKTQLLVVYGLVELHRDTSEWSAQGLGNSLAALFEAGWRNERKIVVLEERKIDDGDEGLGGLGEGNVERKTWRCWQERVPILNGSVRRAGLESEDGSWSGRTVEMGRILGRWFRFGRGDWDGDVDYC